MPRPMVAGNSHDSFFQMEHAMSRIEPLRSAGTRRSIGVARDTAAFSYQELDLSSARFLTVRLFFAVSFFRGLLGAFLVER